MKKLFVFLTVVLFSVPVLADCYTSKEAEAEQGIRIHSELMVIGLNCQHLTPKGQENLYVQFQKFTQKHASIFSAYENSLIGFYKKEGVGNPEAKLHQVRTDFANEISKDVAVMRPDIFCKTYAPRIPKAAAMSGEKLHQWASMTFPNHPTSLPVCAQ